MKPPLYHVTFTDASGEKIGEGQLDTPVRYLHFYDVDQGDDHGECCVVMSDEPDPDTPELALAPRSTFRRVGSAVWVNDDRFALYERLVS